MLARKGFCLQGFPEEHMMEVQAKGGGEGLGYAVTIQGGAWVARLAFFV